MAQNLYFESSERKWGTYFTTYNKYIHGFPGGSAVKNLPATQETQETQVLSQGQKGPLEEGRRHKFYPRARKVPWRRAWQPTSVFLPGESHGQRSLSGLYSPWGRKESDMTGMTEHTHRHTHTHMYIHMAFPIYIHTIILNNVKLSIDTHSLQHSLL